VRRLIPPAVFSAVAVLVTWPLAVELTSRLGALQGPGDPFLNLWVLGWDLRTISTHPAWLLTGRVFDANIFYPSSQALAYSDHQLLQALAVWPIYAISHNITLCYNAVLILSLILSAWAMYAFAQAVTGSRIAASCAGLVWGFCPFRMTQLPHIQLQALYWMPLTFLLLHRLLLGRRMRDAVWLGVITGLQAISSVYYGVIGGLGLITATFALVVAGRERHAWSLVARLMVAAVVAALVAAPGVWPYWRVQQREGFGRTLFEAEHGSATPASYVQAPPTNLLYGRTGWLRPSPGGGGPLHRRDGPEQDLFPGFVVLALAALGLARARRQGAGAIALTLLLVGAVGFILSLGPDGIRPLYATLYEWVFGFHAVRAPARFAVLVLLALAVLAGLGVDSLARGSPAAPASRLSAARGTTHHGLLAPFVLLLMVAEFLNGSLPWTAAPPSSTPTGRWLQLASEQGPVVYLPVGNEDHDTTVMVASLEHGRPIVNGYSGQRPQLYDGLIEQMASFPAADALLTLHDLGIRFVIAAAPVAPVNAPSPLVERARLEDGVVYELRWTSDVEAALEETADVTPPPAGPRPFPIGETARYQVHWLGGPMTVPAGEAVAEVERSDGEGFQFTVHATTASWMRPFFPADDAFETRTDARLFPSEYRMSLNEGRRHLTRTVIFDPIGRHLTITTGQTSVVTLPLARGARDPVSTFFYTRTLPLAADFQTRVPVDDAGQRAILELRVTGTERLEIQGKRYDTWKLEPTLISRARRGQPIHATAWISRDERKIPLMVRVSGPFGDIELELTAYHVP
jgi:hypothetical protein